MPTNKPTVYRTNAGSRVGRPQKGFEPWRKFRMGVEPLSFEDFLHNSFEDIIKLGGKITFWYVENENWYTAKDAHFWNYVQVKFEGKELRIRSLDSFRFEHNKYMERFEKWKRQAFL